MRTIRITRRAFPDCGEWTVWKPHTWETPFFKRLFGHHSKKCKRAKLLFRFPIWPGVWYGLFMTFGTEWLE